MNAQEVVVTSSISPKYACRFQSGHPLDDDADPAVDAASSEALITLEQAPRGGINLGAIIFSTDMVRSESPTLVIEPVLPPVNKAPSCVVVSQAPMLAIVHGLQVAMEHSMTDQIVLVTVIVSV
jgi:hypothetical protein